MEILKIFSKNQKKIIRQIAGRLKNGATAVCPTDTVYGLICDVANKKAVEKIFKIKKRPKGKPISIFVNGLNMAEKFSVIGPENKKILKKIWPGAVTVLLKPKKNIPGVVSLGKNTIGLRIPKDKFIIALVNKLGSPLAETSANISGLKASTNIKEVLKQFEERKYQPDIVLDAGNIKPSLPSTVIDLTGKKIKVLRIGPVDIGRKLAVK